jgi:hypothetical protein
VILGKTKQVLTDTFLTLKQEALKAGLTINVNKTKYLYCIRKPNQQNYLIARDERLEQVNLFKYRRTTVNTDSSIEEEIKESIAVGNRPYHVHKKLLTSKLISQHVKLQIYDTLIHPVVTSASKTWVLKGKEINMSTQGKGDKQTDDVQKKDHEKNIWPYKNS